MLQIGDVGIDLDISRIPMGKKEHTAVNVQNREEEERGENKKHVDVVGIYSAVNWDCCIII
ncbi:Hypothetical predicted protein [Scomber scombrus]|uniref:Uncharacterized protein n=1 Tax=Scomber scombrus TaxID=13677 RepID=A0AAV1Q510_SCOSC